MNKKCAPWLNDPNENNNHNRHANNKHMHILKHAKIVWKIKNMQNMWNTIGVVFHNKNGIQTIRIFKGRRFMLYSVYARLRENPFLSNN